MIGANHALVNTISETRNVKSPAYSGAKLYLATSIDKPTISRDINSMYPLLGLPKMFTVSEIIEKKKISPSGKQMAARYNVAH